MKWQLHLLLLFMFFFLLKSFGTLKVKNSLTKFEEETDFDLEISPNAQNKTLLSDEDDDEDYAKRTIKETDSKQEDQQKQLEIEENKLLKRKNALTELLKLNISNLDITEIENNFDASYSTLKLINEKLHDLKNMTNNFFRKNTNKKKENFKENKIGKNKNNKREDLNNQNTIKGEKIKSKNFSKINNKNEFLVTNNSLSNNTKAKNSEITGGVTNKTEVKLTNVNSTISEENFNITLADYLKEKRNSLQSEEQAVTLNSNVTSPTVFNESLRNKPNVITENSNSTNDNISTSEITESPTQIDQELNSKFSKKTNKKMREVQNKNTDQDFGLPKNMSKESLYTRLINISLSLIVIGLLMGVLVGLILVMYVNSKKESKS